MLVKFFKRGIGNTRSGNSVKDYLLNEERTHNGTATVLRGDVETTTAIIDSLKFSKTYTSGCLSFTADENISDLDKQAIIDNFEQTLLPSLDADQYQSYWVEHTDKGRLELNFVITNVELLRGTALTVYNHATDKKLVDTWKQLTNLGYNLDDPSDPINRRNYRPSHLNGTKPTTKKDIANDIGEAIDQGIQHGWISNRQDVIQAIKQQGYEVVDDSHEQYLKIANPDRSLYRGKPRRPIKLVGDYYQASFSPSDTHTLARKQQSRAYQRQQHDNIEQLQQKYGELAHKRAERLQQRYRRNMSEIYSFSPTLPKTPSKIVFKGIFSVFDMIGYDTLHDHNPIAIRGDYERFRAYYQNRYPNAENFQISAHSQPKHNELFLQLCANINKRLDNDPNYLKTLFNTGYESVLMDNSQGLNPYQIEQLFELATNKPVLQQKPQLNLDHDFDLRR